MKSLRPALRLISFAALSAIALPVIAEQVVPLETGGDKASRRADHVMAYTLPMRDQTSDEFARFMKGVALFEKDWTPEEGLGPQFNQASCQTCHPRDGRMGMFVDGMHLVRSAQFGGQVQDKAIEGAEPEGDVLVSVSPRSKTNIHVNGRMITDAIALQPPQLVGLGLLERIPVTTLEDMAAHQPPGISGRIHYVTDPETGKKVVGRFGWKAGQPTLKAQIAKASAEDMGLNNALYHQNGEAPSGKVDISDEELELLADYVRNLAVPARRDIDPDGAGFALFKSIGCAACHTPSITLANGTVIWPFTDMLLHDTGNGPWDRGNFDPDAPNPVGTATRHEWRTPPLWGIGLLEKVARDDVGFMHDASAPGIRHAIEWHENEAAPSVRKWRDLSWSDQEKLLAFLRSL